MRIFIQNNFLRLLSFRFWKKDSNRCSLPSERRAHRHSEPEPNPNIHPVVVVSIPLHNPQSVNSLLLQIEKKEKKKIRKRDSFENDKYTNEINTCWYAKCFTTTSETFDDETFHLEWQTTTLLLRQNSIASQNRTHSNNKYDFYFYTSDFIIIERRNCWESCAFWFEG